MNSFDFIIAFLLSAIGLWLLCMLLKTLLSPFLFWFGGTRGLFKFRKYSMRLEKTDELIKQGKFQEAILELKKTPFIEVVNNQALLTGIKEHNQGVLSRCSVIADALGTKTDGLSTVETLFQERIELLSMHVKSYQAYMKIKLKRKETGKATPQWTKDEFEKKRQEISEELVRNQKDLNVSFNHLMSSIQSTKKENILYH